MQPPEYSSITGLGVLAKSLSMRLTRDELRWLYSALKKHADDDDNERESTLPVLAGYRDMWDQTRDRTPD